MEDVRLTREQLYDLVWAKPVRTVGNEFGITDVGLKKICRRHNVPTPGLGYWARLAHGQKPRQARLPVAKGSPELILIRRRPPIDQRVPRPAAPERPEPRITVASQLRDPHPLVRRTKDNMDRAARGDRGASGYGCLNIYVGPKSLSRALLIFDALLKECQARHYPVTATDQYPHETRVVIKQLTFTLELTEAKTRIKHELTPEQKRKLGENRFTVERWHDEPNGRLRLRARLLRWQDQKWEDGKVQKLEAYLDEIFEWLERTADSHIEMEKRRAEEDRIRYEREQKRREEQRRVEELKDEAARWREACLLREYIEAARAAIGAQGSIEPGSPAANWLAWASSVVETIDPLSTSELRDDE